MTPGTINVTATSTRDAVEAHLALVGIEVGDHPQEQALPRPRGAGDGQDRAPRNLQSEGPGKGAFQALDPQPAPLRHG